MAKYIDLEKIEFLKVDGNKEFNHGVDCCINKLLEAPTADVIELEKYKIMAERCKAMTNAYVKLRKKIDEAIEEIEKYKFENHRCFHRDNIGYLRNADGVALGKMLAYEKALEILKRNIGECKNEN